MKAIFASAEDGGFGYKGNLPWPTIKEDLRNFKELTLNNYIVMGYNTYSTLPKLPKRTPVVISRYKIENEICLIKDDNLINNLIDFDKESTQKDVFLIGGASILTPEFLRLCDEIYHTEVKGVYPVDVFIGNESIEYLKSRKSEVTLQTDQITIRKYYGKL